MSTTGTYTISTSLLPMYFSGALSAAAVPTNQQVSLALGVYNSPGSNKIVQIQDVRLANLEIGTTTSTVHSVTMVSFINAHTSGATLTPIKMDTSNADLPTQVVAYSNPGTVTTTGATLRTSLQSGSQNNTNNGWSLYGRILGGMARDRGMCNPSIYDNNDGYGQYYTIREGEGLTIYQNGINNVTYPMTLRVWAINTSTNACYIYTTTVASSPIPLFSILNGTGSGVVLGIYRIEMLDFGNGIDQIIYSMEPFEALNPIGGTLVAAIPHDTNVPLPSSIFCGAGQTVVTKPTSIADLQTWRRTYIYPGSFMRLMVGSQAQPLRPNAGMRIAPNFDSGINYVLDPGTGFGIFLRDGFNYGNFEAVIRFTVEDANLETYF